MTTTVLAVFPTKVDRWVMVLLGAGFATSFVSLSSALAAHPGKPHSTAIAVAALLLPYLLVVALALPTRYELHPDQLVIRSGLIRYRIPYADLREAHPSRNLRSSPAWSLDRIKLVRTKGYMLISPPDKQAFLRALQPHTPQLKLEGDRLVLAVSS